MRKSLLRTAGAGALVLVLSTGPAVAQDLQKPDGFPQRPVTVLVPYGAGGGSDQLARAWASAMTDVVGVGIQVVNKPGGGGLAAVPDFMSAPKDGYTILESIDDAVTNFASGRLQENPAEDWWPVCITQITFNQIYIRPDEDRFTDWQSFVSYAQENPGQLSVANVGNLGSMERVNMLLLERQFKFETNQVAFDKPSERYASLIGGHVDALFEQPGDVRQFLEADKMKPVLTFLQERPDAFAGTPSLADIGANFEPLTRFRGFWIHPGVAEERRRYLEEACRVAFNSEGYQKFNRQKYMHLIDSYRDHKGAVKLIDNSSAAYKAVYKDIGLTQ